MLLSLLVTAVVTSLVLLIVVGAARHWRRAWPAVAGVVLAGLALLASFAYPLVVEPLFNDFTSLPEGSLRSGVLELAEREGVAVDDVLVADASRRTTTLNAYVSGIGATKRVVLYDNLKSAVTSPHRYEPDLNPTYAELARHYGAAVIPARVRRPRDKAKVEQGVLLAERWILAALRHHTFFSLEEVRQAVRPLLEKLNSRPMKKLKKSRRELFEEVERAALRPLPAKRYEYAEWARPRVRVDYRVEFDGHFYSVPYQLVGQQLDVRATASTLEVMNGARRLTSHLRSFERGGHTTKSEHMPRSHQAQAEWTPLKLVEWAKKTGPATAALVEEILRHRVHARHGFQACLGVLHLSRRYEAQRIEADGTLGLHCACRELSSR